MRIRAAVPEDAAAIAALNAAAWRRAFAGVVDDAYLAAYDGAPQRRREDLLAVAPDAVQLVAEDDDGVVGWVMGHPCGDEDCAAGGVYEIQACYVAPSHWRAGTGRRLVHHLLAGLDPGRWREVVLWTPRDAVATRRFYDALGFHPDGGSAQLERGGPVPIVRLRRPLRDAAGGPPGRAARP